jgi:hypothetical protein
MNGEAKRYMRDCNESTSRVYVEGSVIHVGARDVYHTQWLSSPADFRCHIMRAKQRTASLGTGVVGDSEWEGGG